jgi:hypothetical protein
MNRLQANQVLETLDRAVGMEDMTEREVMTEILQAWARMPPQQTRLITTEASLLKKSAPQLGDRGVIELVAKLGMFLKANNAG